MYKRFCCCLIKVDEGPSVLVRATHIVYRACFCEPLSDFMCGSFPFGVKDEMRNLIDR